MFVRVGWGVKGNPRSVASNYKRMDGARASIGHSVRRVLLNTLCISYGHIHGQGLLLQRIERDLFIPQFSEFIPNEDSDADANQNTYGRFCHMRVADNVHPNTKYYQPSDDANVNR